MVNVCDIQVMKPLLQEHGFRFSKAKGQNFLIASWVPESIAREAGVDDTAGVLEIGPGIGPLTQQLCLNAGKVCAVELDTRLKPILDITVGEFSNLDILWADALKLDLPALVRQRFEGLRPMACANLPYYITTPILAALLEAEAAGLPVIATCAGGVVDIVRENGVLIPPGDQEALETQMLRFAEDPQLRRHCAAASVEIVKQYDANACAERYTQIYEQFRPGKQAE